MRLSEDQREILIDYTLNAQAWLAARAMEIHVGDDFGEFQRHLDRFDFDAHEHRNPGFDPRYTDVGPHNALYVLIEQDGHNVATVAGRVVDVADMEDFVGSGRIFYGRGPRPADFECRLMTGSLAGISGRLAIGASAFVTPRLQNKNCAPHLRGISTRIVLLIRTLLLRHFEPDLYCALIRDTLVHKGMDRGTYRHKRNAELWLQALDGNIHGILERPPEVTAALASFLREDQLSVAETSTRPVTVLPSSLTGHTPPI